MKQLFTALLILALGMPCLATLSTTYAPDQYNTNGTNTTFTASWGFFSTSDLVVTYTSPTDVDTVLSEGSGTDKYTVYAANSDYSGGATITTYDTYPANGRLTIERLVPYGQQLSINGDFVPAKPLETQLDKLAAQNQQILNDFTTTISFPSTDLPTITYAITNSATVRAGQAIGFDVAGSITTLDIATEGGAFTAVDTAAGLSASGGTISGKVDDSTLAFSSGNFAIKALGVDTAQLATDSVTTAKVADQNITKAKIEAQTAQTVLGNTTLSASPVEVPIVGATGLLLDTDLMTEDSALKGATQQSIKAFVEGGGGYTPTAFTTEEVVVFPNGLKMKFGTSASIAFDGSLAIVFDVGETAFTAAPKVFLTKVGTASTGGSGEVKVDLEVITGFTIHNGQDSAGAFNWQAIGY